MVHQRKVRVELGLELVVHKPDVWVGDGLKQRTALGCSRGTEGHCDREHGLSYWTVHHPSTAMPPEIHRYLIKGLPAWPSVLLLDSFQPSTPICSLGSMGEIDDFGATRGTPLEDKKKRRLLWRVTKQAVASPSPGASTHADLESPTRVAAAGCPKDRQPLLVCSGGLGPSCGWIHDQSHTKRVIDVNRRVPQPVVPTRRGGHHQEAERFRSGCGEYI